MVTKLRIRAAVPGQLVINDLAWPANRVSCKVRAGITGLRLPNDTNVPLSYTMCKYSSNICMLRQHVASRTLIRLIVFQFNLTSFR